jgi:F-type H+-transporting ATPase subunit delta
MAGRYANALYELAAEEKAIDQVVEDLNDLAALLEESADLRRLVDSPVFSTEEQTRALEAILKKAKVNDLTSRFLGLVARNRRLFAVRQMISGYKAIVAAARGELTAVVTSASPLTAAQTKSLTAAIKAAMNSDVQIDARVDESLLGGLIVKVGSRQIDTSLRTKLNNLKIALKEVG